MCSRMAIIPTNTNHTNRKSQNKNVFMCSRMAALKVFAHGNSHFKPYVQQQGLSKPS